MLLLVGVAAVLSWGAQVYLARQVAVRASELRELEEASVRIEREINRRVKILSREASRLEFAKRSRANFFADLEAFFGRNGLRLLGVDPKGQKGKGVGILLEIRFEGEYRSLRKAFSSLRGEGFGLCTESLALEAREGGTLLGVWSVAFLEEKK